jgi:hypothetical protein
MRFCKGEVIENILNTAGIPQRHRTKTEREVEINSSTPNWYWTHKQWFERKWTRKCYILFFHRCCPMEETWTHKTYKNSFEKEVFLSHEKDISDKLKRIGRRNNFSVVFKINFQRALRSSFRERQRVVVSQGFSCECGESYFGELSRTLFAWLREQRHSLDVM